MILFFLNSYIRVQIRSSKMLSSQMFSNVAVCVAVILFQNFKLCPILQVVKCTCSKIQSVIASAIVWNQHRNDKNGKMSHSNMWVV